VKTKTYLTLIFFISLFTFSCKKDKGVSQEISENPINYEVKGLDLSFIPEIRTSGIVFKNEDNVAEDMLETVRKSGHNTVRIRLWKNPSNVHSGFEEVKNFANEVKSKGMKVWITVHYSDTWADPGAQAKPQQWQNLNFPILKDSIYKYTKKIVKEIDPDYIQIGNEINFGLLWPEGKINNMTQMLQLLDTACKSVRINNPRTRIIMHYAGLAGADYFFDKIKNLSFDLLALSYYPIWHGKDLNAISETMDALSVYNKKILIAETSYPFTFNWNDYTNNVIGNTNQIISNYPASPVGQKQFLLTLKGIINKHPNGAGLCYWGAEWVAFKGNTATNGSSWENQALWDFDYKALPALNIYK
jgi:arabinogalactan endo-1,4-beta-galactosidase